MNNPVKPKPKTQGQTRQADVSATELEALRAKISDLILQNPEKAAIILTEWIKQSARTLPRKKAG